MRIRSKNKIDLEKLQNRVVRLEEFLTHQAVLLEELGTQLLSESKARATLDKQHKSLLARIMTLETNQEILEDRRPPPHY